MEKARKLLSNATSFYGAKGKKIIRTSLTNESLDSETISKYMLGPTGNLRAPAIIMGKTVLVGFNQELYQEVFG